MARSGGSSTLLLVGGALAALAAFATTKKDEIMSVGSRIVDTLRDFAFKQALPDYAQPYAEIILQVSRESAVDPFLIFALGDRESAWGTGSGYKPKGPAGTGDWTARSGKMPPDGLGWGRGLMQIDYEASKSVAWNDALSNVRAGVRILKQKLAFFQTTVPVTNLTDGVYVVLNSAQAERRGVDPGTYEDPRPLDGDALLTAAIAAYNTGEGNVLRNLAVGLAAEHTTTGGDYASDVQDRIASALSTYNSIA